MRESPVKTKDFIAVLKELGFTQKPSSGGSHEKWEHPFFNGRRQVVTVDAHHSPFTKSLLKSMISQAGLTKREFFKCLANLNHCETIRKKYDPAFAY